MRNNTQYLELFNKNIVFDNNIYKIIKVSSIYIYGLQYIHDKQLILCDDVVFYSFGDKHLYTSFKNDLQDKPTKIKISSFYNYHVLDDDINIEDIFIFNNDSIHNYKDSIFYTNIRELELLYNIRYLIKSVISPQMKTEQKYNTKIKNELLQKLNFVLNAYKTRHNITDEKNILDGLTEYTISFLKEPYINYYNEYLNITLI